MRFAANLREETIETFASAGSRLRGYLLSSHRVTPATLTAARQVRAGGASLMADNGTKPMIDEALSRFAEEARPLSRSVREARRALGRSPRAEDLPTALRSALHSLAERVDDHCEAQRFERDADALLDLQLSMEPTELIALESFAVATRLALGLDAALTGEANDVVDRLNRGSLDGWRRTAADPRCTGRAVYAVVAAFDHDGARRAARQAAVAGARDLALGWAGIGLEASAIDHAWLDGRRLALPRAAPQRVVRLVALLTGLARGARDAGLPLRRLHLLGFGAAGLLPLVAASLDDGTEISLDATSPIHDAVRDRVIYDPAAQGRRLGLRALAGQLLAGAEWPLPGPFLQGFAERHGHDVEAARRVWAEAGRPALGDALQPILPALAAAMPLLLPQGAELQREALRSHIAHNHWALSVLAEGFERPGRRASARAGIERLIAASPASAALSAARAVLDAVSPGDDPTPSFRGTAMASIHNLRAVRRLVESAVPAIGAHEGRAELLVTALDVARSAATQDWTAMRGASQRALAIAGHRLGEIERGAVGRVSPRPAIVATLVEAVLRDMADSDRRIDRIAELRLAVSGDAAQAARLAPSLALLEQGRIDDVPLLDDLRRRRRLRVRPARDLDLSLACWTRGLLGLVQGALQGAHHLGTEQAVRRRAWPLAEAARQSIDDVARRLDAEVARLQGEVVADSADPRVSTQAHRLATEAHDTLLPLARVLAALHAAASDAMANGRGGLAERFGRQGAEGGMLLREAIALCIAARRLACDLAQARAERREPALAVEAHSLPSRAAWPNLPDVELSALAARPPGSDVEVGGFVESLESFRSGDGKLVSRLLLLDPSSRSRCAAEMLFVHAGHAGITAGSYARLGGRLLEPAADGRPQLAVLRLGGAAQRSLSWRHALLQTAARWFDPLRNGHRLAWCPGPPEVGGAQELVFLRLVDPE